MVNDKELLQFDIDIFDIKVKVFSFFSHHNLAGDLRDVGKFPVTWG